MVERKKREREREREGESGAIDQPIDSDKVAMSCCWFGFG